MGEFVRSPTCNQVLSTYDVSHVINFTRLSPFLLIFCSRAGRAWERGYTGHTQRIAKHLNDFTAPQRKLTPPGATFLAYFTGNTATQVQEPNFFRVGK